MSSDRKPYPYLQTKSNEVGGELSPDRWLASLLTDPGLPVSGVETARKVIDPLQGFAHDTEKDVNV
jgi:hypothetical protein